MSSHDENSLIQESFKKAQRAMRHNNMNALKEILDGLSPSQFSTVVNECNENLLFLSFIYNKKEIFHYLMTLGCFDLEATNHGGNTLLTMALLQDSSNNYYYARILISSGININRPSSDGNTYLHIAVCYRLFNIAKLLIEKGADLNAKNNLGETPLHKVIASKLGMTQGTSLLIYYGVDPTICGKNGHLPFNTSVINGLQVSILRHLFYYTLDSHSEYIAPRKVLITLIQTNSSLLEEVLEIVSDEICDDEDKSLKINFSTLRPNILKILIEKLSSFIRINLTVDQLESCFNIEIWEILLDSELRCDTIDLISKMRISNILSHGSKDEVSEKRALDLVYYLLTYDLPVRGFDFRYVYEEWGYCDLFKIMLHIDSISGHFDTNFMTVPVPEVIYDIHYDFKIIQPNLCNIPRPVHKYLEPMLDYFANPKLQRLCERSGDASLINRTRRLPAVASLVQLARDATRRYVIQKFKIKRTSQYYTFLKKLPITATHEMILSFETKLYD